MAENRSLLGAYDPNDFSDLGVPAEPLALPPAPSALSPLPAPALARHPLHPVTTAEAFAKLKEANFSDIGVPEQVALQEGPRRGMFQPALQPAPDPNDFADLGIPAREMKPSIAPAPSAGEIESVRGSLAGQESAATRRRMVQPFVSQPSADTMLALQRGDMAGLVEQEGIDFAANLRPTARTTALEDLTRDYLRLAESGQTFSGGLKASVSGEGGRMKAVPFLGGVFSAEAKALRNDLLTKVRENQPLEPEEQTALDAMALAERNITQPKAFWRQVGEFTGGNAPYAMEFAFSTPAYVATRMLMLKGLKGAPKLLEWTLPRLAGVAAQTATAAGPKVADEYMDRIAPRWKVSPETLAPVVYDDAADRQWETELAKAGVSQYIENLSERTGGLIGKIIPTEAVSKLFRLGAIKTWWNKFAPKSLREASDDALNAMAYHGVPQELFEDYVGVGMKALAGVDEQHNVPKLVAQGDLEGAALALIDSMPWAETPAMAVSFGLIPAGRAALLTGSAVPGAIAAGTERGKRYEAAMRRRSSPERATELADRRREMAAESEARDITETILARGQQQTGEQDASLTATELLGRPVGTTSPEELAGMSEDEFTRATPQSGKRFAITPDATMWAMRQTPEEAQRYIPVLKQLRDEALKKSLAALEAGRASHDTSQWFGDALHVLENTEVGQMNIETVRRLYPNEIPKQAPPTPAPPKSEQPLVPVLFVRDGNNLRQVTAQQASEAMSRIRNETGAGSSKLGSLQLYDQSGKVVAHVSYNGNVWLGKPGSKPTKAGLLYNASGLVWDEASGSFDYPKPPGFDELAQIQDALDAIRKKDQQFDDAGRAATNPEFARLIRKRDELLRRQHGSGTTVDVETVKPTKPTPELGLQIEDSKNLTGVKDFSEASQIVDELRQQALEQGMGANMFPQVFVVDVTTGKRVARISYNGRVWDMQGKEMSPDAVFPKAIQEAAPAAKPERKADDLSGMSEEELDAMLDEASKPVTPAPATPAEKVTFTLDDIRNAKTQLEMQRAGENIIRHAKTEAEIRAAQEAMLAWTAERRKARETSRKTRKPAMPRKATPQPQTKSAGDIASAAAKAGVQGADEALKGLHKLFGGGKHLTGPLGLPSFSEETYAAAKPHFKAAYDKFVEAGQGLMDFFKFVFKEYGEAIRLYLKRFAQETQKAQEDESKASKPGERPLVPQPPEMAGGQPLKAETAAATPVPAPTAEDGHALSAMPEDPQDDVVQIAGINYTIIGKDKLSPAQKAAASARAQSYFAAIGIPGIPDTTTGPIRGATDPNIVFAIQSDGNNHDVAGKQLLEHLTREIQQQHQPAGDPAYVSALVNAINKNFVVGNWDGVLSPPVLRQLMEVSAGESSWRGSMLRAVTGVREDMASVARNAEFFLHRTYTAAFGGPAIKQVVQDLHDALSQFFTEAEILSGLEASQLQYFFDEAARRASADIGNRVYRRVQAQLKPKKPLSPSKLEANALLSEAVQEVLAQAAKLGIHPRPQPGKKKLTAIEQLALMTTPETAGKIDTAIALAVRVAERNAAKPIVIEEEGLTEEEIAAYDARTLDPEADGHDPSTKQVAEGLKSPQFAHWVTIKNNLLGYDPITVKLAQDVVKEEFKGAKFGQPQPQKPKTDTRINLTELAKAPDAEVARVLEAHLANIELEMDLAGADEGTKARIALMIQSEVVEQVERIRRQLLDPMFRAPATPTATITDEQRLAQRIHEGLFRDPRLNLPEMVRRVAAKSELQRLTPKLADMVKRVFATPSFRRQDISERFGEEMAGAFGITDAQQRKAVEVFAEAYRQKFAEAAKIARAKAEKALTPIQRRAAGLKTPLWQKLMNLVNTGGFDDLSLMRGLAKAHGWKVPTSQELEQMREWANTEQALREPKPRDIERAGGDVEAAQEAVSGATLEQRQELFRKMNAQWSKWTMPIAPPWKREFWMHRYQTAGGDVRSVKYNTAMALNEWMAANLLAKVGFGGRQVVDVLSQMALHTPTRAIAHALQQWADDKAADRDANLIGTVAQAMEDAYRVRLRVLRDALNSFKRTLGGRGEQKNVDQLLTSLGVFDRMLLKTERMKAEGKPMARFLELLVLTVRMGRQFAAAMDAVHGLPAEAQELAHQVRTALRDSGKSKAEQQNEFNTIFGILTTARAEALAEAREILEARGLETSKGSIERAAWHLLREKIYHLASQAGMPADDWKLQNHYFRNVIGWNEPETGGRGAVGGPGGLAAATAGLGKEVFARAGIPGFPFMFGNAIGISINRKLAWTPLGFFPGFFRGSPWFEGEIMQKQRKVEAAIGTSIGTFLLTIAALGIIRVLPAFWPRDDKERAEWTAKGYRPGMVIIPTGNGTEIKASTTVGPLALFAPYLMAGGTYRRIADEQNAKYAAEVARADRLGLEAGPPTGLSASQRLAIVGQAAYAAVLGGRTAAGMLSSYSDFGQFNPTKSTASAVSAVLPGVPAFQELQRMRGVTLDPKASSVWDMVVPLQSSGAARVNVLGDPMRSESDVERVFQVMTGGSSPIPMDSDAHKANNAYAVLYNSDFRPPAINPGRGYDFDGTFRSMTDEELERYTVARGQEFQAELSSMDESASLQEVASAFRRANTRALASVGAKPARIAPGRAAGDSGETADQVEKSTSGASTAPSRGQISRPQTLIRGRAPAMRRGYVPAVRTGRTGVTRAPLVRRPALRRPRGTVRGSSRAKRFVRGPAMRRSGFGRIGQT